MQYDLFDFLDAPNPLIKNMHHTGATPIKRKRKPKNPYNSIWLKAYVDALFNNRAVHIYRKY